MNGASTAEALGNLLALTTAVVTATERAYRLIARPFPDQWESLERSATTFTNEYVMTSIVTEPVLKQGLTKHRRRKLGARAGKLQLLESDRDKRARWVAVAMPPDAPIPIKPEVADALPEALHAAEGRLEHHLTKHAPTDPLVL